MAKHQKPIKTPYSKWQSTVEVERFGKRKVRNAMTKQEYDFWDDKVVESHDNYERKLRRETSRLASMANKRVQRLEDNNLTDTPAYKIYVEGGRFGVRGKTFNEVQQELSRLRRFVDAKTSTIRGTNAVLREMAANTGMKYDNMKDLRSKAPQFFELASKVEQYLRNVEDIAAAIGYQKIWEAINEYVSTARVDLGDGTLNIEDMVSEVTDLLKYYEEPVQLIAGWYKPKDSTFDGAK